MPDPFKPDGAQAEAARALRVDRPLGPHTYMYRPSAFSRLPVKSGATADETTETWQQVEARFQDVVAATWNGYVETIRTGRYTDLHALRTALGNRRRPFWAEVLRCRIQLAVRSAAQAALDAERRRVVGPCPKLHELAALRAWNEASHALTLRVALLPGAADMDDQDTFHRYAEAGWGLVYEASDCFGDTGDSSDDAYAEWETRRFRPTLIHLNPRFSRSCFGSSELEEMEAVGLNVEAVWHAEQGFVFYPDDTLDEAAASVGYTCDEIDTRQTTYKDAVEVVNLRLAVLETVLFEHEVYGHVPLWGEMTPEGRAALTRPEPVRNSLLEKTHMLQKWRPLYRHLFNADATFPNSVQDAIEEFARMVEADETARDYCRTSRVEPIDFPVGKYREEVRKAQEAVRAADLAEGI